MITNNLCFFQILTCVYAELKRMSLHYLIEDIEFCLFHCSVVNFDIVVAKSIHELISGSHRSHINAISIADSHWSRATRAECVLLVASGRHHPDGPPAIRNHMDDSAQPILRSGGLVVALECTSTAIPEVSVFEYIIIFLLVLLPAQELGLLRGMRLRKHVGSLHADYKLLHPRVLALLAAG